MLRSFVAVSALAAIAAAGNCKDDKSCKPVSCPLPPKDDAPAPVAQAKSEKYNPDLCIYAPVGLQGIAVKDVAYEVSPALYNCKADYIKIWCEKDDKNKKEQFWYCCGSTCNYTPAVPEDQFCKVNNKKYIVGQAYENVKYNGKTVTLWCTSPDNVVTCNKKTCGSTINLTPPGLEHIPAPPKPTTTSTVKPTITPTPTPPAPVWCKQWNGCMPGTQLKPNANQIACIPSGPRHNNNRYPWCTPEVCCDMVVPPTTCADWFGKDNACPTNWTMVAKPENVQCSLKVEDKKACNKNVCCVAPPADSHCNAYKCTVEGQWPGSGRVCSTFESDFQCSDEFCKCGTNPW